MPENVLTMAQIAQLTDAQRISRLREYMDKSPGVFTNRLWQVRALLGFTEAECAGPENYADADWLSAVTPGE